MTYLWWVNKLSEIDPENFTKDIDPRELFLKLYEICHNPGSNPNIAKWVIERFDGVTYYPKKRAVTFKQKTYEYRQYEVECRSYHDIAFTFRDWPLYLMFKVDTDDGVLISTWVKPKNKAGVLTNTDYIDCACQLIDDNFLLLHDKANFDIMLGACIRSRESRANHAAAIFISRNLQVIYLDKAQNFTTASPKISDSLDEEPEVAFDTDVKDANATQVLLSFNNKGHFIKMEIDDGSK